MKFEQNYRILDWIVAIVSLETTHLYFIEVLIVKQISIIKVLQEINSTPIHSYILYENITFYAEQKMIEVDGVRKKIPT